MQTLPSREARTASPRVAESVGSLPLEARWLGQVAYRDAWSIQHRLVALRAADLIPDQLLLLEHDPVLTLGRHAKEAHILATPGELAARGIEVIRVERGGEVTFHGPGQLVAYPIIGLSRRGLLLRPLVRALEAAMVETCAAFEVAAARRDGYPGCWCEPDGDDPRKIGALGIRVERGVSYHGIALNVSTDLSNFDLIDPCGMPGVRSTSIAKEKEPRAPVLGRDALDEAASVFARALATALGTTLAGDLPPDSEPARTRQNLEEVLRDAEARLETYALTARSIGMPW